MKKILLFLLSFSFIWGYSQLPCTPTANVLSASELNAFTNSVTSYTYTAATYGMSYNVTIAKVGGNGPNIFPYGTASGIWIGKDNGISLDYEDILITFSGDVTGVSLDFVAINNNSDGEERVQNIYPQNAAGNNITAGVTYIYHPGVPTGSPTATYFNNTTKTIHCNPGTGDNGRINISSTTPFRKVKFRHREITNLSFSGPNGVVLTRLAYCTYTPEIAVNESGVNVPDGGTLNFGNVNLGAFVNKTLTVTNTGVAPLTLGAPVITGTAFSVIPPAPVSIAGGGTGTITLQYNPSVTGAHTEALSFTNNDLNENPYNITLTGTTLSPEVEVVYAGTGIPVNSSYTVPGFTYAGSTSAYTVVISNTGTGTLTIGNVTENSTEATITSQPAASVAPGGSTSFNVNFSPQTAGLKPVVFTFSNNDFNENPYPFTFVFNAQPAPAPEISVSLNGINIVSGSSLTIPLSTPLNTVSDYTFQIQNSGNAALNVQPVTENHTETSIVSQPSSPVASNGAATFTLRFAPVTTGTKIVTVSMSNNDSNENPFVFTLILTAVNGVSPEINVLYNSGTVALNSSLAIPGSTTTGSVNNYAFTVQNTGSAPLITGAVSENSSEAMIVNPVADTINAGGNATFILQFAPITGGTKNVQISIPNNDANENPYLFTVVLNALSNASPEIAVSQSGSAIADGGNYNYGSSTAGNTVTRVFTITNSGTASLSVGAVSVNCTDFTVIAQPGLSVIPPSGTTTFSVRYNSAVVGTASCSVSFTNTDANESPYNFTVTASTTSATLPNCSGCNGLDVNSNPSHSPNLLSAASQRYIDRNPTLKWQHDEGRGITYYQVQIWEEVGTSGNFTQAISVGGNTVNTVNAPSNATYVGLNVTGNVLSYNKRYQWKVTGYNAANQPVGCFQRIFRVAPVPAAQTAPNTACDNYCNGCGNVSGATLGFGSLIGDYNNVPVYKNGGCETNSGCGATCYNPHSTKIVSQSQWIYGWQCVEYPVRYYRTLYGGMNITPGNGKDYYDVGRYNRKGFRQFPNGQSTEPPRAGDIITTKKSNNNASPGHVAVVKSISPAISPNVSNYTLHVVQQNVGESPGLHLDGQWTLKRRNGKWSVQRPAPNVCLGWIRGIPNPVEPGSVNSVPVINTTTPVFAWARHRNMKSYDVFVFELSGNCYQQISGSPVHVNGNNFAGLSFPALQPGKSYKWYVRNNFFNGSAIRSDAYYFSVAPNAIPTSGNSTVNGIGENYSYLDIRTIGSQLDDAGVWFKNDSVWTLLGNTHNDGYLEIDQELSILTGDSLRVERKGYSPLTMPVTPEITAGKLYLPMFENVQSPAKLKVVLNNNDLITSSPSVAIHVSGQNFLGYMIGKNGAFFETQVYSPVDTLVNFAPLDTGLNLIDFAYFNATDTFYINKDVYYIPTLSGYTISVTLNNTSSAKGMLLLNGHPFKTITGSTTFTLPAEVYDLTFTGFGYENERFLIEGDTVLSLTAIPRPNFTVSHTLPFSAGDSVKYMGSWMTVKYTGTQSITAMRSPASVPGIFNPVSETFQAVKPIPDNAKLQLEVIIDKSYVPATGFYVLIERNGVSTAYTEAEFGDSIVYEPEYQILKFLKLYGNEKLTLVEPAMPLPVTALMEMNAEPMDNRWILLNWLVQDSDNLSHFVVQRSLDGSQGFAGIGQVPCPPNHDIATPFVYEDYSVIPEVTYYYRVITTNVFGEMEYSPVVSARLSAGKAGFVSVYPNPVKDWMTIQLHQPVSGSIYAEVVNELGQVLMKPVFVSPDNRPAFSLNVEKLPPSVYIIRIKDENGGVFSEKFVKQ